MMAGRIDPVAAFLTATGITDATIISALNTLYADLVTYGLWSKMIAIYPFVGGTAATHKFNFKNPQDTNAAFRLSFIGGWTHSSTGALPNGVNAYANTFLSPSQTNYLNFAYGDYLRTNSDGVFSEMGLDTSGSAVYFYPRLANGLYIRYVANEFGTSNTNSIGIYILNLINGTFTTDKNGTNIRSLLYSPLNISSETKPYYISAGNTNLGAGQYSNRQKAFTFFSDGLTLNERANLYTTILAFQTTLGR